MFISPISNALRGYLVENSVSAIMLAEILRLHVFDFSFIFHLTSFRKQSLYSGYTLLFQNDPLYTVN
jgi:hypothetical protein